MLHYAGNIFFTTTIMKIRELDINFFTAWGVFHRQKNTTAVRLPRGKDGWSHIFFLLKLIYIHKAEEYTH